MVTKCIDLCVVINSVFSVYCAYCNIYIRCHYTGMRLEAKDDAFDVMTEVRRLLSNTTFNPFLYSHNQVQIISGEEEGVFAWVALNYIVGFFDKIKYDDLWLLSTTNTTTFEI